MNPFEAYTSFADSGDTFREANAASSNGRLFRGVTIIRSGLGNKRDRHFYTPEAMKEAVEAGLFTNLRAFVDHPTSVDEQVQPERSVRDLAGVYKNPRYIAEGNGGRVVADLHILEPHAWVAKGIRELASMGLGDKVGISILGSGETVPDKVMENGQEFEVKKVRRFSALRSADIVTQAGAGGGFSNFLESSRETWEMTDMDPKAILASITEAAAAGDTAKVLDLTAQLKESTADATADADDVKECGDKPMTEGDDKAQVEEAKDDKAKDAVEEADEDDEDVEEAKDDKAKDPVEEAGDAVKPAGKPAAKGQKFGESAKGAKSNAALLKENEALRAEVAALKGANKAAGLKAHIARKLSESKLPEKTKGKLRGKLILMSERADVDAEVAFQEAMFDDVKESALSSFEEVEGNGGGAEGRNRAAGVEALTEAFSESGLKLRKKA